MIRKYMYDKIKNKHGRQVIKIACEGKNTFTNIVLTVLNNSVIVLTNIVFRYSVIVFTNIVFRYSVIVLTNVVF